MSSNDDFKVLDPSLRYKSHKGPAENNQKRQPLVICPESGIMRTFGYISRMVSPSVAKRAEELYPYHRKQAAKVAYKELKAK